ncbi:MAG TPA: glycosyltransferase, partial [Rhodospirillaceae bacterium]|nr:glycosyltransferase [Rhodospirillaceae bacterium]
IFKTILVWLGGHEKSGDKVIAAQIAEMDDASLPVYTILVPMFRDAKVLPILVNALRKLDYPAAKLDIKLVLEATDVETIEATRAMGLESTFEIIRVPESHPQTKPKACNYALPFARGEYLVIYDAEHKPEPDQLKKTLLSFQRA